MTYEAMAAITELDELRDALFHRIGRNLVNYQLIESLLKALVAHGEVIAPIGEIEFAFKGRILDVQGLSLGILVRELFEKVIRDDSATPKASDNLSPDRYGFSLNILMPAGEVVAFRNELDALVRERNFLAHGIRQEWIQDSIDTSKGLIDRLDQARERTKFVHHQLFAMAETIANGIKEHVEKCSTDEGLALLEQERLRKTRISRLLTDIAGQCAEPGTWIPLAAAGNRVRDELPEYLEKPGSYCGYGSLKNLMIATDLFEFREPSAEARAGDFYRLKYQG